MGDEIRVSVEAIEPDGSVQLRQTFEADRLWMTSIAIAWDEDRRPTDYRTAVMFEHRAAP